MERGFLVRGEPEDAELHAKELLSMTSLMALRQGKKSAGYDLCLETLQSAVGLGATSFGVISYPQSIESTQHDTESLPLYLAAIMERVQCWMEENHDAQQAVFVLDTVNTRTNPVLSRHFTEYLMKSSKGRKMRNIVPSPFWVDSRTTAGCQVADIIAHVLMNSARERPQRKEGLQPLWDQVMRMQFHSYGGVTRGIRKMKRQA